MQWPIEEVEKLRGQNVKIANAKLQKGEKIEVKGITPAQVIFGSLKFYLCYFLKLIYNVSHIFFSLCFFFLWVLG